MPRMGEQLERWAREVMRGTPTVNSGAKYEDADMKVDGVGGRLYEFKSSKVNDGLSLRRDHILILLQRALKLNRQPVFIYQNKSGDKYAVIPVQVLANIVGRWDAVGYVPEEVKAVKHAFSTVPSIISKGNNIRIPEADLKKAMDINGLMMYITKNKIQWVILEAMTWLTIAGDLKKRLICDQCGAKQVTEGAFRCAKCFKVKCNEHSARPESDNGVYLICEECEDV